MPTTINQTPQDLYRQRKDAATAALAHKQRIHVRVAWIRVATFVAFVVLAYEAAEHRVSAHWLWVAALAFVGLSVVLGRIADTMARHSSALSYFDRGLRRIDERWMDESETGTGFADESHLFANDLDLFDRGGLFGLLCVARTPLGKATLATWLKFPAPHSEISARQEAVRELAQRSELREALWQCGARLQGVVDSKNLKEWLSGTAMVVAPRLRWAGLGLAIAALPALWMLASGSPVLAIVVFGGQMFFARRFSAITSAAMASAENRVRELELVSELVGLLEGASFDSRLLKDLRAQLVEGGLGSRQRLQRLIRWVRRLEDRRNLAYTVITAPFLWGTQMALGIEAWRAQHGPVAARWVESIGTIEALASLATFSFEHPEYPFPAVVPDSEGPLLEGDALAHPLLPRATRIANSVKLDRSAQLVLISGSNMSGKSTFLRTVGINAVLALAGAPVCAQSLRVSRLQIGATLRTHDSLQGGVSRFFAEIQRLRDVVGLAERSPLTLYLLDEILHGTNSQDRMTGGEALIRTLLKHGCIGLVTTHDLALTRLAEELSPQIRNAHFQDRIEGATLIFDYTLRPGVVTRSNALDLMRLVGLKV